LTTPGMMSLYTDVSCCGACRMIAATRCTVVRCFSRLALGARNGRMWFCNRSLTSTGGATGTYCESVKIARLRTAGRECERSGAIAGRGCGDRAGSDTWAGKRVMSIDSVDNVSIKVSGGVSVYKQLCQEHDQYWKN
jgi:hypothetical protein